MSSNKLDAAIRKALTGDRGFGQKGPELSEPVELADDYTARVVALLVERLGGEATFTIDDIRHVSSRLVLMPDEDESTLGFQVRRLSGASSGNTRPSPTLTEGREMTPLETSVRILVSLLVRSEYETAERVTRGVRLTAGELRKAIDDYGRTLVEPPAEWWSFVDALPLDEAPGTLDLVVPLWTREEGESDLSLELRAEEYAPGLFRLEVLDVHVL